MGKAPPAFQFYPNDFVTGTRKMSTLSVGGYILLLCAQWDDGSVPGDSVDELAQIMRCSRASAKLIWDAVRAKFVKTDQGWQNERLEEVRTEQAAFRAGKSKGGKAGAAKRWQNDNKAMTEAMTGECQKDSSPYSDLHTPVQQNKERSAATTQPRRFDRSHADHVLGFCDFKCLSDEKINTFAKDLPGGLADPENYNRVRAWAETIRDTWGASPKIEFEWWKFWEARWKERPEATPVARSVASGRAWAARKDAATAAAARKDAVS